MNSKGFGKQSTRAVGERKHKSKAGCHFDVYMTPEEFQEFKTRAEFNGLSLSAQGRRDVRNANALHFRRYNASKQ